MIYVRRFVRILVATFWLAVRFPLRGLLGVPPGPQLLAGYFQFCGGVFIKFGQMLATRYDLLPPAYTHALTKLLDQTPTIPYTDIVAIIERDLERPLASCLVDFEMQPIGSASIAQVHRARLLSGERVVIKVKHPGSETLFHVDAVMLRFWAGFLDSVGVMPGTNLRALADHMIRLTAAEYDFRGEARNIQMFHQLFLDDGVNHYAPRVYFEHSGDSIIVMEYLEGLWLYELLYAVEKDDRGQLALWAASGINPSDVATALLNSIITQCYRHHVFHADPHPANILIMNDGKLAYIDFGLIGWIEEQHIAQDFRLNRYLLQGDVQNAYQSLLSILQPSANSNMQAFELEAKELLYNWVWNARQPAMPPETKSTAALLMSLLNLVRRYRMRIPLATLRLYRTIIVADNTLLKLDPDLDRFQAMGQFINEEILYGQRKYLTTLATPEQLANALMETLGGLQQTMQFVNSMQYTLPQMVEQYTHQQNPLVGVGQVGFRLARGLLLLALVVVVGGKLIAPAFFADTAWNQLVIGLGDNWALLALLVVALLVIVNQAQKN